MSQRQRRVRVKAVRSRVARAKVLRRRARGAGARRGVTAATAAGMTAAAVTLAGVGASPGTTARAEVAEALGVDARNAGFSLLVCDPHSPPSDPFQLADVGGTLFFSADDGPHGHELWRSDGTRAGTVLVKDINPTEYFYSAGAPRGFVDVGGTLFFSATDDFHGRELWTSDGTRAGTVLVRDIVDEDRYYSHAAPGGLVDVGGTLFFSVDDGEILGGELWKSDGTPAGTVPVKNINPDGYYGSDPRGLVGVGERLFFAADDGIHGRELWTSDGTGAGTVLVKDINIADASFRSFPSNFVGVGGRLFFSIDDGIHGPELWTSDGTEAGTVLVKDIDPSAGGSDPFNLVDVGGTLFFAADDGVHGMELWKSDGTEAGTVLVEDIRPGGGSIPVPSPGLPPASFLTDVGGTLFFAADDGTHGLELWTSDGTEAGTVLVKDIDSSSNSFPESLVEMGGTLFFSASDGTHGRELWTSDGTEAGTVLVKNIHPADGRGSLPHSLTDVGGRLYFSARDGIHGHELWTSDGTRAGTILVKDINAGGWFTVASAGRVNTSRGTMRVRATVAGDGRLVARPVAGSLLRKSVVEIASAGQTTIVLRPTRAGMRILRQKGTLRVRARFTFTPCGGTASSVIRRYTLQLK